LYDDGTGRKFHRLPDKSRKERRLVVSGNDAFDVLTAIHLKLGHPGRNKCFFGVVINATASSGRSVYRSRSIAGLIFLIHLVRTRP